MAAPQGLARIHRFRGEAAFSPVLSAGKRLQCGEVTLVVARAAGAASRFGVSIGRRVAAKATFRNRLKRAAKEAFRRHPAKNKGLDMIVLSRAKRGGLDSQRWAEAVGELLDRACELGRA